MCLVSCVGAMVYTASATSTQGKARCLYSSYTQVVDKSVDKFISVDFVVDKFWDGVDKANHELHALPPKTYSN